MALHYSHTVVIVAPERQSAWRRQELIPILLVSYTPPYGCKSIKALASKDSVMFANWEDRWDRTTLTRQPPDFLAVI